MYFFTWLEFLSSLAMPGPSARHGPHSEPIEQHPPEKFLGQWRHSAGEKQQWLRNGGVTRSYTAII